MCFAGKISSGLVLQKICTTLQQSWPIDCPFSTSACANAVFLLALVLNRRKIVFSEYSLDKLLRRKRYDDIEVKEQF